MSDGERAYSLGVTALGVTALSLGVTAEIDSGAMGHEPGRMGIEPTVRSARVGGCGERPDVAVDVLA